VLTLISHVLHSLSLTDDRVHACLPPRHLDEASVRAGLAVAVRDVFKAAEDPSIIEGGLSAMEEILVRRARCPPVGLASNATGIDGRTG
jgi:hypothetical protein